MKKHFRVRQSGERVELVHDGRLVAEMDWEGALDLSRALRRVGKLAEEESKHAQVILDSAILFRGGVPFGLACSRKVAEEAIKEACWGDVRRYMPGGVKSREFVGAPKIIQHEVVK